MREILFKAKRTDNGEWVEGALLNSDEECRIATSFLSGDSDNNVAVMVATYKVDPETICRNTEMIDKNKKDIWEHDIVRAWSEGSCAVGEVRKRIDGLWIIFPAWQDRKFWGLCPNDKGETTVEVIGNVFDNPDLLKGGDNT